VFLVTVYGGYFGAAAGVLLLALLLIATGEPLARRNAMKNLLLGLANGVAARGRLPGRWTTRPARRPQGAAGSLARRHCLRGAGPGGPPRRGCVSLKAEDKGAPGLHRSTRRSSRLPIASSAASSALTRPTSHCCTSSSRQIWPRCDAWPETTPQQALRHRSAQQSGICRHYILCPD